MFLQNRQVAKNVRVRAAALPSNPLKMALVQELAVDGIVPSHIQLGIADLI